MAVALVSNTEANSATNANVSGSETIGAGSTLLLVALDFAVATAGLATSPSVTWNGVSLTQLATKTQSDSLGSTYLFGMVNPATGTHTLAINFTAATGSNPGLYFGLASYSGTDTSAIGTAVPAANILTDASTPTGTVYPTTQFSVTTASGDAAFAVMQCQNVQFSTMAVGTLLNTDSAINGDFTDGYSLASGATTNLQFGSGTSGNPCCSIAVRIQQPQTAINPQFSRFEPPPRIISDVNPKDFQNFVFKPPAAVALPPNGELFLPFDPPAPQPGSPYYKNEVSPRSFQDFINAPGNPNQFFGNTFSWWPQAPKPPDYAKDWIEFYQQTIIGPPATIPPFTTFERPPKPPSYEKDWIEFYQQTIVGPPSVLFPFSVFDPAPRPHNFARDWIEFYQQTIVGPPAAEALFTPFERPPKPPNYAKDWIEFYQQTIIGPPSFEALFTEFSRPPRPSNFAKDWVEFYQQTIVGPPATIPPFTNFDPAPRPHNYAKDWIEFYQQTTANPIVTVTFGGFAPFDPAPPPHNRGLADPFYNFEFAPPTTATPSTLGGFTPFDQPPKPPRFAKDWIEFYQQTTAQVVVTFSGFTPFDPPAKPPRFAKDWIEFFIQTIVGPPSFLATFTDFYQAPKPKNFAKDWIEFYQQTIIGPPNLLLEYTTFERPPKPSNFAKDWIEFFQQTIVGPFNLPEFTPFERPPKPPSNAKDWIEFYQQTTVGPPAVFFPFANFDPAPRPRNFAKDWVEFFDLTVIGPPATIPPFSNFDPAPRPRNFSKDWIEFYQQTIVGPPSFPAGYSQFDPAPKPSNFARDWVASSSTIISGVSTPTNLSQFTNFDPAKTAKNFAVPDWITFTGTPRFTATPTTWSFMPFDPAPRQLLYSRFGQQPQWWTYEFDFKSKVGPPPRKRDTHDGMPRRRRPSVYEQEYYDKLNKELRERIEEESTVVEPVEPSVPPPVKAPNLLIPLSRLIKPVDLPSLVQEPPKYAPGKELFEVIAREIEKETEEVYAMILSDMERDREEFKKGKMEYERLLRAVKGRVPIKDVMKQLSEAADKLHKSMQAKKRVIYNSKGRPIGIEYVPDDED